MYQLEVILRTLREAIYLDHRDTGDLPMKPPVPVIWPEATAAELRTTIDLVWSGRLDLAARWFGVSSRQVQRWLYNEIAIDRRTAMAMWVKRREFFGDILVSEHRAEQQGEA